MKRDVIIIGGGAAGLFCAIEAGKRGRSTLVLEHAERIGKKSLSRRRPLHLPTSMQTLTISLSHPHFVKSPSLATRLVLCCARREHNISFHKKSGQLFCATARNRSSYAAWRARRPPARYARLHVSRLEKKRAIQVETNQHGAFDRVPGIATAALHSNVARRLAML